MTRMPGIFCALLVGWMCATALGQSPADADLKAIGTQISSASPEHRQTGIAAIREMMQQQPPRASSALRGTWGKLLLDAKEYAALEELCLAAILATPADTQSVELFLQLRIRGAIAQGKPEVALQHAKSLFNVASMATTNTAMLLVAEALAASDDPSRVNTFRDEQLAGARQVPKPTHAVYSQRPEYGSRVLASIKVDAEPYLQKLKSSYAEDYWSLIGRGNLMLLADRAADARELFERAYSAAQENQINQASESLARCIKANDGVIGRANSWVAAIRPVPQATNPAK